MLFLANMNASNTWASVALTQPARPQPAEPTPVLAAAEKCAIVDASALIGGTIPRKLADNLVTTAEVLQEIKDKQSRQTLDTLPYGIAVQEPKETSVEAGQWVLREPVEYCTDGVMRADHKVAPFSCNFI